MGIKNFNDLLRRQCPDVFERIHISQFAYKRIAVDVSLYMHKYKAACGDKWLASFMKLIASLRRNEVHCVFIFDGKAPVEKEIEREKRKDTKDKMEEKLCILEDAYEDYLRTGSIAKCLKDLYNRRRSPKRLLHGLSTSGSVDMNWVKKKLEQKRAQIYTVDPKDFQAARDLFDLLDVPYYIAPWEAEKMASKLCIDGKVDAVLSEDTDVLAYSTPQFLSKIDTASDTCVLVRYDNLLDGLGITSDQLLDLCIMCGTDYNSNIKGIGYVGSFERISECGSIDNLPSKLDITVLNHVRVRSLFREFEDYKITKVPFCGIPDFKKLETFIEQNQLYVNMEKLHKDFAPKELIFIDDDEVEIVEEDTEFVIEDD